MIRLHITNILDSFLSLSLLVVTSSAMDVDSIPVPWPNREKDVNISSTFSFLPLSLSYISSPPNTLRSLAEEGGGSEEGGVTYLRLRRSIYIERNGCGI